MAKKNMTTFTGSQKGLSIVKDRCYAYSGLYAANTTAVEVLNFHSGKEILVIRLYVNGTVESGSGSGEITTCSISLNGDEVSRLKVETGAEQMPTTVFNDMVIPPLTNVTVTLDMSGTNSGRKASVVIVGRVYA